jgi:peptidoglycan/LPS O-acetylase OafA/YrhL
MTVMQEPEPIVRRDMPELDTLRGLAVLLVFLYHGLFWSLPPAAMTANARTLTALFRYGWSGVQLFFVLSGFLITGILIQSKDAERYYRTFYVRRALRILPAFLLLVATLLVTRAITWRYALVSTAFVANLSPLFGVPMGYPPLWSLAVEEQFYAVWPAAVRRISIRLVAITAAVVFLASPALRAWAFSHGRGGEIYYYSWFNLDGLALGAILAVIARGSRRMFARTAAACVVLGFLIAVASAIAHADVTTRLTLAGAVFQSTLLYLIYGTVVALALLAGSSRGRGFVSVAPLRWLGYISYGLYLVHVACFGLFDRITGAMNVAHPPYGIAFVALRFAIAGSAAIVIATISRRYYEEFFLSMKDSLSSAAQPATTVPGHPPLL